MKNKSIKIVLLLVCGGLLLMSCREEELTGDEFSWSPDGSKLAFVNIETRKLLVAEVSNNALSQMIEIDSCQGDNAKIFAPGWSNDGNYLIYTKFDGENFFINTIQLAGNKFLTKANFKTNLVTVYAKKVCFPVWSPAANRILYTRTVTSNLIQIVTSAPDGSDEKVVAEFKSEYSLPEWSPDGSGLVFSEQKIEKTDTTYILALIDSSGKNVRELNRERRSITKIDWSPDGRKLAFVEADNKHKNIWLLDVASLEKTRLTQDNVENCYGWNRANQLLFTVEYPKELVQLSGPAQDKMELSQLVHGLEKKNLLILFKNNKFKKLGNNIYSYHQQPTTRAQAFFKKTKLDLMEAEYYLPMIQWTDGSLEILAHSASENLRAVDEQILAGDFDRALWHLTRYWGINFNQSEFENFFAVAPFSDSAKMDSSKLEILLTGFHEAALTKTIYVLRHLKQTDRADWLREQFARLILYYIKHEKNFDEFLWNVVGMFGKYNEFEMGIDEFELIEKSVGGDSLFRSYANLAQALLAQQLEKEAFVLEKIRGAVLLQPRQQEELEPYNSLLFLYLLEFDKFRYEKIVALFRTMLERFPDSRDAGKTYELLGDFLSQLGNRDQARAAYQAAILKQKNDNALWRKFFDLQSTENF